MLDRLIPLDPPADDPMAYEGPFGWVKAVEGVKLLLEKANKQYIDDLLTNTVADYCKKPREIPFDWNWEGLVVVSCAMTPLFPFFNFGHTIVHPIIIFFPPNKPELLLCGA